MDKQYLTKYLTQILMGSSLFALGVVVGASLNYRDDDGYMLQNLYPSMNAEAPKENGSSFDIEIKLLKPKSMPNIKAKS